MKRDIIHSEVPGHALEPSNPENGVEAAAPELVAIGMHAFSAEFLRDLRLVYRGLPLAPMPNEAVEILAKIFDRERKEVKEPPKRVPDRSPEDL